MSVTVSYRDVTRFSARLAMVAPTARRETRSAVREAGSELTQAVQRASAWSSRIPGAVEMKVSFGERSGGVRVSVNSGKAPHARVLEFPNRGAMVRHPVFGNRNNWVETPGHPFFFKTVTEFDRKAVRKVSDAIDQAMTGL